MSVVFCNVCIDLLCGILILFVLLYYFNIVYLLCDIVFVCVFGWDMIYVIVCNGNYGVIMFFVILGYLIMLNVCCCWGSFGVFDVCVFYVLCIVWIVLCLFLLFVFVNGFVVVGVLIFVNYVL